MRALGNIPAVAGRFVGTLVLTTALRAAGELGLTRMDLPFLLGTIVSADRTRAKPLGYVMHFVAGSGSRWTTSGSSRPLLEPPGFMMLNYGRRTPLATTVAHVAYGTIVGGFVSLGA